ncbi:MAG TPA: sulfotransferase [Thermoanaerobaculia bacterium]|nr:sulfotransferase [Thermoanaerobaculia bacterium]
MPALFVTGMQRSGTTLLDKLLANHPQISLLSQPFPLLFVEVKRRFLALLGEAEARYPLGDLFLETRYGAADLHRFLAGLALDAADLRAVFAGMAGYSGQYTRFTPERLAAALETLAPGDLAAVLAQLYRSLAQEPTAGWYGGKEALGEELLPFLLDRGFRALVIVRDPRDVLASLNHGRGPEHAGRLKPTLFNVRNWRKSAAFVLHLEDHPNFFWLRYEDLVARPREVLERISSFLAIEPFAAELLAGPLRDQEGRLWPGNSSHGERFGIETASVSRYREILPPEVARYVEAACWPELRCFGYEVDLAWEAVPEVIRGFADPYEGARPELKGCAAGAAGELRRCELLRGDGGSEVQPYFLFDDVCHRLREVLPA